MFDALIATTISAVIGGVLYYVGTATDLLPDHRKISKRELLMGTAISAVVLLIAAPLTEHLIVKNKVTFHEYYNGYEKQVVQTVTNCERDGNCNNTYSCDPYVVMVTYTTTDGKGKTHTHTRPETRYHYCPYLKQEYAYSIETTLGTTRLPGTYADTKRDAWREDKAVPSSIQTGPPPFWIAAKQRIDANKNGGVTEVHDYTNYLLASNQTILSSYSADIERYTNANLLPAPTLNYKDPIHDYYLADKFQGVSLNLTSVDNQTWNEYLMRLNGYLGAQLQGDVHLIAIDATKVTNADGYSQALFAHWKDTKTFGRDTLSKNSIAIAIGVKDKKIIWARATGGLTTGNEALLLDIQNNLRNTDFTPDNILGTPHGEDKAFNPGAGILATTLWGTHKFTRPCMECIEEQQDGYKYLKNDSYVTTGQKATIVIIATILSTSMWVIFLYIDDRYSARY